MSQMTLSEAEYHHKKRKTRREKFMEQMGQMELLTPWARLEKGIMKHYPQGRTGAAALSIATLLHGKEQCCRDQQDFHEVSPDTIFRRSFHQQCSNAFVRSGQSNCCGR